MGVSPKWTSKTGKMHIGDGAAVASNWPQSTIKQGKYVKRHARSTIAVKPPATRSQKHMDGWLFTGTLMSSSHPLRIAEMQHSTILMCPILELKQ